MLSLVAPAALFHPFFWGAPFFFFLIPLFWILVIALIIGLVGRSRRRRWAEAGYGPGHWGPWGASGAASAETVLNERFARGDIEEQEYRARLEVLRANSAPRPGTPRP